MCENSSSIVSYRRRVEASFQSSKNATKLICLCSAYKEVIAGKKHYETYMKLVYFDLGRLGTHIYVVKGFKRP